MEAFGHMKSYMDYVEKRQSRKLVLFGAGQRAPQIITDYFAHDEIEFICDNNRDKWGKTLMNIPVCPPEKLLEDPDAFVVIITIAPDLLVEEITAQLDHMGIPHVYNSAILPFINSIERYDGLWAKKYHELNTYHKITENYDKIKQVRTMLCDEKSLIVYDALVQKMKYNLKEYTDICDDVYDHYFSDGVFEYSEEEVFVDGGSFDGVDTIRFARIIGKKFKKSYCFEPDDRNYLYTCNNLIKTFHITSPLPENAGSVFDCGRFTVFKSGLYNRNAGVGFISYGAHGSRFIESERSTVPAVKLDDVIDKKERITLIKLDIEGVEMAALEGAREIIQKDKPKLAICIYHNLEDLWEIPLYIKYLVPEYRLFVRHHTKCIWDSVLYATL
jgi:FkbM family methyltransferase